MAEVRTSTSLRRVSLAEAPFALNDTLFQRLLEGAGPLVVVVPFFVIGASILGNPTIFARSFPPQAAFALVHTLVLAVVSVLVAAAFAIPAAAFVTILGPRRLRSPMARLVAFSSSVPTVLVGAFGYFSLAPFFRGIFPRSAVSAEVAAVSVLAMAIAPTIANIARRLALAVPSSRLEAAIALGAARSQVARSVLLPATAPGLLGALLVATGRAAGEAGALLLLAKHAAPAMWSVAAVDAAAAMLGTEPSALGSFAGFTAPLLLVTFVTQSLGRALIERTKRKLQGARSRADFDSLRAEKGALP